MLEGVFTIIPHILVLIWAGSALAHRIMKYFRYQFDPYGCKVALTDVVNVIYFIEVVVDTNIVDTTYY